MVLLEVNARICASRGSSTMLDRNNRKRHQYENDVNDMWFKRYCSNKQEDIPVGSSSEEVERC